MTWEEAKDQIAKSKGSTHFQEIIDDHDYEYAMVIINEAADLYAREKADKAWEAGGERMYQSMSKDSENRAPFKEELMRQLFPEKESKVG